MARRMKRCVSACIKLSNTESDPQPLAVAPIEQLDILAGIVSAGFEKSFR
jgi:hypothetical protein